MNWPKGLNKKIRNKVSLSAYTSFKIGGPAKYFFEPKSLGQLRLVLAAAKKSGIKVFILGSGSNILVDDPGLNGLVIKLGAEFFKKLYHEGNDIIAGSGLKLSKLILFAKEKALSGLEFFSGIPGTLGGSIIGNAGAQERSIGGLVKEIQVLDYSGNLKLLKGQKLKFGYRKSNLDKYIIISVKLKLRPLDKNIIAARIKEYLLWRNKTQNNNLPNAGCIFKNPPGNFAGRLIDLAGLKGRTKGAAAISNLHANFILNTKNAKSSDVLYLMDLMRKKVKKEFGISLEPEIKIWK